VKKTIITVNVNILFPMNCAAGIAEEF